MLSPPSWKSWAPPGQDRLPLGTNSLGTTSFLQLQIPCPIFADCGLELPSPSASSSPGLLGCLTPGIYSLGGSASHQPGGDVAHLLCYEQEEAPSWLGPCIGLSPGRGLWSPAQSCAWALALSLSTCPCPLFHDSPQLASPFQH